MGPSTKERFNFAICECRPDTPFRGRDIKKHTKNTQHTLTNEFLLCPEHLETLNKTADSATKQKFYAIHEQCKHTKVTSNKVKEFLASVAASNYVENHKNTHFSTKQISMTVSLDSDRESSDGEEEEEDDDDERENGWKELLQDLTPKESEDFQTTHSDSQQIESTLAVNNLIASETANIQSEQPLIPGHSMKTLSNHALKDTLNKEKAINKDLRSENESLKRKIEKYKNRETANKNWEAVLQNTQAVLAQEQLKIQEKAKELDERLENIQKEFEEKKQTIVTKEQQLNKAETILNKRYKEFKAAQSLKSTPQTYRIHIPIKQNQIVSDPFHNNESCFANTTCGHVKVTVQDNTIQNIKWRNHSNTDRSFTQQQQEDTSDEEDTNSKRQKLD